MDDQTFCIRDNRQPGGWWANNDVIDRYGRDLGVHGIAVYCVLARHASNRSQQCWPGIRRIGELIGTDSHHVLGALRKLEAAGLVRITSVSGRGNVYTLCDPGSASASGAEAEDDTVVTPTTGVVTLTTVPLSLRQRNKTHEPDSINNTKPVVVSRSKILRGELAQLGMSAGGIMAVESHWTQRQIERAVAWVRKLPEVSNPAGYLLSLAKTGRDPDGFVPPSPEERAEKREANQSADTAAACWERDRQPCSHHYSWCSLCAFEAGERPPAGENDRVLVDFAP